MMDHEEALRILAHSRYLTGDLSAGEAEAFEEHFFDCPDCARDVTTGAMFAENARAVFQDRAHRAAQLAPTAPSWWERFRAGLALPLAAAACLLLAVVVYQNAVTVPRLRSEVAVLSEPQPLTQVPLKLARGEGAAVVPKGNRFFMPYFYLSQPSQYPFYSAEIENSKGTKLKTVTLPAPAPGQPISILLRRSEFPAGRYVFRIRGQNSPAAIATYTLDLDTN